MKEEVLIVKIGGNIIDDAHKLDAFLDDFAGIEGPKILVHGGGKVATAIGAQLGLEPQYVDGRRITDKETLSLVTMVYGGLVNKNMVAALQSRNCNAIGLTGADGNMVRASKRPVKEVDYGYVGDVGSDGVNSALLSMMLDSGLVPVIAPLTHNGSGDMLNTNADTMSREIACALATTMQVKLIYCFEQKGLLRDMHDEHSIIPRVDSALFDELKKDGVVSGGMIPKLENALQAARQQVSMVVIGHAAELTGLIAGKAGTRLTNTN
ncbi:MAG: acetylglutamate kinase [Bacteroidetes bacterium 46-16]|nr:MAG: acetylglutamate kinase [Bacteroidetes bacterium 46-16]